MENRGKLEGLDAARKALKEVAPKVLLETKRIFTGHVVLMRTYVRKEYLAGGTTVTRLAVRSGALRSSTRELPVVEKGDSIESGIGFGMAYAKTHVGPEGQVTTIKPKKGKYLAIPLDAARMPSGDSRGGPRSGMWGRTFVFRTHSGALMIFGRKVIQKGAKSGMLAGKIIPLFVLVKQVKVKTRVFPGKILAWSKEHLIEDFKKIGTKLTEGGG